MPKLKVTVTIDEHLRNEVAELAAVQERSFSAMWSLLVRRGLVAGEGPSAVSPGPVKAFVPVAPKVGKLRTGKCVHMVPVEAHCKWGCDPR